MVKAVTPRSRHGLAPSVLPELRRQWSRHPRRTDAGSPDHKGHFSASSRPLARSIPFVGCSYPTTIIEEWLTRFNSKGNRDGYRKFLSVRKRDTRL
jgi:hypothetical protein